ncbi:putative ABC transporter solute binding protein [Mycolicibacterium cyprinidarum]|uniref:ABC transporter solute binding protein n=1 Tax=Mycolicibacterium cyprinidarum TaxID=2860311 RepID=A0ABQ4V3X6_9MYCO|nr:putative ABC transporter solute binding protein [Mycolicibacterium sp. NGTWSNA01]GJF15174.1 putative ABC transporter solute binding protein [Mycolicibacterium sp. NGTWS0302]
MRALVAAGAVALLTISAVGCSQDQPNGGETKAANSSVKVVASTDVWGSVTYAVTGDHATVTSIVYGTVADPHSFEASPADTAEISDASLVVFNGGGYDHWVDEILAANPGVPNVDAYSLLATTPQPANEHVFYDLGAVKAVANSIAEKLSESDSAHAADYATNAAQFGEQLDTIAAAQRAVGQAHPGVSVVSTEPVAYYALRNAGINDKTPAAFADAMEQGNDPAPVDVAAMLDLIKSREVSAIVVNTQTETAVTQQIVDAARQASLPVISVTETLPEGLDYLGWQRATVDEIAAQLDSAPPASR